MKLTHVFRTLAFGFLFSVGSSATAAAFQAKISNILIYDRGDLVYIYVVGGTKDKPACSGSNGDYLSFSMKRPRSREYLSGLLAAHIAGKNVSFWTHGACIDQTVSDTIDYFMIDA